MIDGVGLAVVNDARVSCTGGRHTIYKTELFKTFLLGITNASLVSWCARGC